MAVTYIFSANTKIKSAEVNQDFADLVSGVATAYDTCRVYRSTDQTITNITETSILFNSERFDTNGLHSTVLNTDRITFATDGVYAVSGHARFASNATGRRIVQIQLNGATNVAIDSRAAYTAGVTDVSIATIYKFGAGDFIALVVYQDSGGDLAVTAAGNYSPEFAVTRLTTG